MLYWPFSVIILDILDIPDIILKLNLDSVEVLASLAGIDRNDNNPIDSRQ